MKSKLWSGAAGLLLASQILGWSVPAFAEDAPVVTSGEAAGPVSGGPKAKVSVRSTGTPVTVSIITDRSSGYGSVGGQTVAVATVHYMDVCNSPCSFELDSGLRELAIHASGVTPAGGQFQLKPGSNSFVVKPGSSALVGGGYLLVILGIVSTVVGVTVLAVDSKSSLGLPLTLGGGAGLGGGIVMMVAGSTSFEPETTPAGAAAFDKHVARAPLGLKLRAAF